MLATESSSQIPKHFRPFIANESNNIICQRIIIMTNNNQPSIPHTRDCHEDASAPTTVDTADMGIPEDEEDMAATHAADAPSKEEEEEEEDAVGGGYGALVLERLPPPAWAAAGPGADALEAACAAATAEEEGVRRAGSRQTSS